MTHFAKPGLDGAAGAGILDTLCKPEALRVPEAFERSVCACVWSHSASERGVGLAGERSGKPFAEEIRAGPRDGSRKRKPMEAFGFVSVSPRGGGNP